MKNIFLIGATGSIGKSTLQVISTLHDRFKLIGISANSNLEELFKIYSEYKPKYILINDKEKVKFIKEKINSKNSGLFDDIFPYALIDDEVDIVFFASRGIDDIKWILETIKKEKKIFIANKESFVSIGEIIVKEMRKRRMPLIPIDSEHSAIFQLLLGKYEEEIKKIILTASGGPFYDYDEKDLENVTVEEALKHPTWSMGKKITIDSSTLFNKGMEVVEANLLFDIPYDSIDVVIHRESIIHSMVELSDGQIFALLYYPDMKYPIQYALTFPERVENNFKKLEFNEKLSFYPFNKEKFLPFKLMVESGKEGGTKPFTIVYANDLLVDLFLNKKIKFLDIGKILFKVYDKIERKEFSIKELEYLKKEIEDLIKSEVKLCT
ncbi:MAG: 1-deoxy-D-xylulose-5-phosphate reductoisomerase [Caldisericia bacterium]